jgi:hypothetical protein
MVIMAFAWTYLTLERVAYLGPTSAPKLGVASVVTLAGPTSLTLLMRAFVLLGLWRNGLRT